MGPRAALGESFDGLDWNRDLSPENFYTISTDAHIDDLVILLLCADKNAAGTAHLEALFDQNLLVAGGYAMGHHPGGAASGGGAGGGIVSVIKRHAGMQSGLGIDGFPAHKVKELSTAAGEIFGGAVEIEAKFLDRL